MVVLFLLEIYYEVEDKFFEGRIFMKIILI